MPRVKILPDILSNKIAAGEVIERPASVVKELLENALDADSTRILIELKNAGKSLIRVTDNGVGMNRDDALLAMERYATSKIHTDQDLFEIKTLGFRGEALPSIASVSRFTVESRDKDAESGTRIFIEGGKIQAVTEIGAPVGTQMSVQDLFFNIPARRKFMKSADTEMGHIADTVARIALAWPGVMFRLSHDGRTVKNWAATEPAARIADVLGSNLRGSLHPIGGAYTGLALGGWVASAQMARNTSRGIYLYVNHRFIRDRMIQHALMEGYRNRLMKNLFPVAVLFLTVPFDQVDVNVHPTKSEVRFADARAVHQLIRTAVSTAIEKAERPKWAANPDGSTPVAEITSGFDTFPQMEPAQPTSTDSRLPDRVILPSGSGIPAPLPASNVTVRSSETQAPLWRKKQFSDLRVIGQFHDTYIICESENRDLILIDQHAAHERIRYELLRSKQTSGQLNVQRLLIPETLELGFEEGKVLIDLLETLDQLGLEIAHFGGNTYVIKSVPSMLADREVAPIVLQLVEKIAEIGVGAGPEESLDAVHKLMACHHALRANQKLTDRQIHALLAQLDACDDASHCPHGRPTWIRWELSEVEKAFRRTV
ncbi:MAG: DNA mismatch repair endonuclease MutL [Pseudomonadota bacterium]